MTTALDHIEQLLQKIDNELTTKHTPSWGIMTAQHMVEHLSLTFLSSTGKWGKAFNGDEARAAKMKANFFSVQYPFPKGVLMPGSEAGKLPELRSENIDAAKEVLRNSVQKYIAHYAVNPEDEVQHPYFGLLTFADWNHFHTKHLEHHLMQFGLLPDPLTPEMESHLTQIGQKLQTVYKELTSDHQAKWGRMNAHQTVEHLALIFIYSTGKFGVPFKGDEAAAKKLWKPFTQAANPWKTVLPQTNIAGDPKQVRNETMEGSKRALKKAFAKYQHYCKENPDAITSHGYLGNITTAQWILVHLKHVDHHLSQFGVIEELV